MAEKQLIELRHAVHADPELSNREERTIKKIEDYLDPFRPHQVIPLATHGRAFVFNGPEEGETILFRAELDALPIREKSTVTYRSGNEGVSHACGHDGHMTILAGLAKKIAASPPGKGKAILLFQPAEEVEQGARDVVEDPAFQAIRPNKVFALHNIPGYTKHRILVRKGTFAAASRGMTVKLTGKTSHAAEPEKGINPARAIARIIRETGTLVKNNRLFSDMVLLTVIHIQLGEIAFGTSPGDAEIRFTLRALNNNDMETLASETKQIINKTARQEKLQLDISYAEIFPAVVNDARCTTLVENAAKELGYAVTNLDRPFRWSEDFSYFTMKYPGCLFGLGAGKNQPALHNPDYNFPDELIDTGIQIFYSLYKNTIG